FLQKQNIFFNVKIGSYQGNLQGLISNLKKDLLIHEKEQKIRLLQDKVERLTNLIQREGQELLNKINDRISNYPEEKEDLKELVKAKLELEEAKKRNQPFDIQAKQFRKIYRQLPDSLPEEFIEEILDNCIKLAELKLELERENELLLVEEEKSQISSINITNNIQRHIFIDSSQFGTNTDLSYNKKAKQTTNKELSTKELVIQLKKKDKLIEDMLEFVILEKEEQISQEKDANKLEVLQEELKSLQEVKQEQNQAQIQLPSFKSSK